MSELEGLLANVVRELDFDYYAVVHQVDLNAASTRPVRLSNYPPSWAALLLERRHFVDDPIVVGAQRTCCGFLWTDVPKLLSLSKRQGEMLGCATGEGLGGGFTVPAHVPGEFFGLASFAVRFGRTVPEDSLPAAQYVGSFAVDAARRIARATTLTKTYAAKQPPRLTPRQLDCLVLTVQGKSVGVIAQLLGISPDTAHEHLEDAKRRLGVSRKEQMVARALFYGLITFSDAFSP
ncbi:MAG TPA: LuxR family transcriptional regulator [Caulobacteraceae bacterium]|nr:LuxR family transcriptional regulator [Caulobacteraceae bacterium]